jgi:glycosyltransferase involved in cell wall biosynthesis
MKIAVIIPAYNEANQIINVLRRLPKFVEGHPVLPIVVDDGSKDKTRQLAKSVDGVKVISHRTNLGKGAAAKTGCDAAHYMGADIFVLMDGDGQHRPEDIGRMVMPFLDNGMVDLVLGVREINQKMPMAMRLGNKVLTSAGRILFGIAVSDSQSGFRVFRREIYPEIRWSAANYAMEMEMLILACAKHLSLQEVKIETIYLDGYKGTTALDGLRILKVLLKWRLLWGHEVRELERFPI